ncbi:ferric reduction oxidase 2-like isoform X2 [Gastrolobium bilobum]|uniref:ferric reduction oxidase 2-like isoform X2 n=1 Tax=Gastrolobium bilobum TaxID=150636 RepID=UPI002AAF92EA|nr:ferric reduction oxidase 2-like isoform X2 [Gastrolobium bilobum]
MPEEMVKRSPSQEKYGSVQSAIRLLVMLLLLGWIFIWIMMPTNTYRHGWLLQLQAKSSSTYFGAQGTTLLISTFPILFIAALGCVYLHIAKKTNGYNMERYHFKRVVTIWKRPMLVKGPLGIVSSTELAFLLMFIALLVWTFATFLHNHFATITQKSAAAIGEKVWQVKLDAAALGLAVTGNICLAFLFFPVARGSSVLPLLGLTSESCIKYHIWLGNMVMTLYTFHGLGYIIYWAVTNQISQMLTWSKVGVSHVAGEITLLFGLFMWVATIPRIRRKAFELFFYTHHLYILFIVFFIFHVGISYACTMLPSFYLFLVDRYLRFLQSRSQVRLVSARVLPCETVELNFSKGHGLTYNPTSVMLINIPSISKLQWHPFTVVSNSNLEQEMLSIVIKSEGTWTKKLYQLISTPSLIDNLGVSVEGPYGPVSSNYLRHDTLVMVSGGSGITPFISIIRELIYLSTTFKCTTPKVVLICVFKNSSCLSMLDLILPISGSPFDISSLQLQIEAYITRDKELKRDNPINLQTIRFKPNPTDAPIYAVLGPNSWLWLGAIISSSFIIFLIIIGIINRYYIFPIDHNSNQIFSFPLRSFLDMLVICVSIVIVASAAVLWNKRQNAKDANQIQNLEGSSPTVSPSMICNADRELESLPYQTLVQATNVHFGARPDLRRLLLEFKGPSVGVLVAGPKKMRQEVAAICSSVLAENLHFESISFIW